MMRAAYTSPGATKRSHDADAWTLEPHCCRACFGRIVSRKSDEDGQRLYQCTNCGLQAEGHKPSVLCACGMKVRRGKGPGAPMVDAGVRCHENKARGPDFPSVITASYGGLQGET